jgi:hypothetical protein
MSGNRGGFKSLAWIAGAAATVAAAVIGAVLAVFLTATMVVITLMGALLLATAGMAMRARRMVRARGRRAEPGVIEARNVGGHSWVAYGWDRRGR